MPSSNTVSERTRIQICGRLSVECDGIQLAPALRGKQVPLLLTYLVLSRGREVGRDELIGALWPRDAPASQDAALRTLLSRLRSALGSDAVVGRDELALDLPAPVWVDYEAAVKELERAQAVLARGDGRGAWALAQIPLNIASRGLLPGVQVDWLEPHRRELETVRLDALEVIGRAGLMVGPGQPGSVERAARALIDADRFRETGYVLLMESLAARGDTAAALRVFEELRTLLRDELGTVPSSDVLATHERLLLAGNRPSPNGLVTPATGERVPLPAEISLHARGRLIGRRRELEELSARWEAARRGIDPTQPDSARLVLVTGEPGIGKTRLLAELARRAHADGGTVLAGRSPEETVVPYQPFLEALRHWVVSTPVSVFTGAVREYAIELSRLMPELRRRIPELPLPAGGEPGTERYRLFEAVVGLMAEMTVAAPILLVLDDLQWADQPSRLLLRHLTRAARPDRVLVVAAHRGTELSVGELGGELPVLRRERLVAEVAVEGLTEGETAELVHDGMGSAPSSAFVRSLHDATGGNPFFVEEIVRTLREAGVAPGEATAHELTRAQVPEGVRRVIMGRLERLPEGAFELLRMASVVGRDFDPILLEQISRLEEEAFLGGLDASLEAGLIAEIGDGRYSFSHALVRETLYEGMSSARQARLHRRVAEALEGRGDSQLTALAFHFARAAERQDAEKAITYARSAAEQASAMLAHEEAAGHLTRAVELTQRFLPDELHQQCELILQLAQAHLLTGERRLAIPAFQQAAALADRLGDRDALAQVALGVSRRYIQPPGVVDEETIRLLERALELLGPEPSSLRARLLARLCGAIYYAPGQRERMHELADEAGRIAETLGDVESQAFACAARRRALWEPAMLQERLRASTSMLAFAGQTSNEELVLQAHAWLIVDLLECGDLAGVDAQLEAFADGAERVRQPLYLWNAIVWRAMREIVDGHLERAAELAAEALAAGAPAEGVTAPQYYAVQLLSIRREQARIGEIEEPARALVASNPARPAWRAALAILLLESDRADEAREHFEAVAREGFTNIPPDGDWLVTMALLADVCAGLHDGARAAQLYDVLLPFADSHVVIGLAASFLGSASRFLGKLAAAAGDLAAARAHLEHALDMNAALPAPVALAHTQLDLAAVLEGGGGAGGRAGAGGGAGERVRELREAARAAAEALDLPAVAARLG